MNTEVEIVSQATDNEGSKPLADSADERAMVSSTLPVEAVEFTSATDRKLRLRRTDLVNQPPAVRRDGGLRSQRGGGSIFKPSWTDRKTGQRREGKTFWISFYVGTGGGKVRVRIDTKETEYKAARKRLTEELARAHTTRKDPRDATRLKFDAVVEAVERRWTRNSARWIASRSRCAT